MNKRSKLVFFSKGKINKKIEGGQVNTKKVR